MQKAGQKAEAISFSKPDEEKTFAKGKLGLLKIGGATIGRATFQLGWEWSTSVQPLVKIKSYEVPHFQCHFSGTIKIVIDDDAQFECGPGDVSLPMGHDAWIAGSGPVVVGDFQGMIDYAKTSS